MKAPLLIASLVLVGCGDLPASPGALRLDTAVPPYSPITGGVVIELHGTGFDASSRVVIGGRESPLVHAIGSTKLEVVVPPGALAGNADIVVFDAEHAVTASSIFHYSTSPVLTSVTPDRVLASSGSTVVTVSGTGFLAEGAGEPAVVVDGQSTSDVTVVDDSTLTFVAPAGRAFHGPTLELTNARGRAVLPHAFGYTPSTHRGLLVFTRWSSFAMLYDLTTQTWLPIEALTTSQLRFRTVFRDATGAYWGIDTASQLGRLDLEQQTLLAPIAMVDRISAVVLAGDVLYAMRRGDSSIGIIDRDSGSFTPIAIGAAQCCGSYSIAFDGTKLWFTSRAPDFQTILLNSYDPASNMLGTPIALTGGSPGFRIEELRIVDGIFYGVGPQLLAQIDPQTGVVTPLGTPQSDIFIALEPYDP